MVVSAKGLIVAAALSALATCTIGAKAQACTFDNNGRQMCLTNAPQKAAKQTPRRHRAARQATVIDASGNAVVRSSTGIVVRVAPSARAALQCVVDHVERAGVKVKSMRGYGRGSVAASVHPVGMALDINQTARNRTSPHVPPAVSNAAADKCGVISGARWAWKDNGHWNLAGHARR